jgi:hypothetical protein
MGASPLNSLILIIVMSLFFCENLQINNRVVCVQHDLKNDRSGFLVSHKRLLVN